MIGWLQTGDLLWHFIVSTNAHTAHARCGKSIGWSRNPDQLHEEPPADARVCSACRV